MQGDIEPSHGIPNNLFEMLEADKWANLRTQPGAPVPRARAGSELVWAPTSMMPFGFHWKVVARMVQA
eukprot:scaffold128803_cov17-Tisochrysis_lutea.AAC.1